MPLPHPLPDDLVELIARRFRVIGEPMRIKLLDRLRDGEATVGELTEALDASQQNVSKHLAVLAEVGILGRRKEGNRVYYRIVDEGVFALCEEVCGSVQQQLRSPERARRGVEPVTRRYAAPRLAPPRPSSRRRSARLGRLGRWTADHVRAVAIAWAIVAVALGVFAPKVETRPLRGRLAGERLRVGPGARR